MYILTETDWRWDYLYDITLLYTFWIWDVIFELLSTLVSGGTTVAILSIGQTVVCRLNPVDRILWGQDGGVVVKVDGHVGVEAGRCVDREEFVAALGDVQSGRRCTFNNKTIIILYSRKNILGNHILFGNNFIRYYVNQSILVEVLVDSYML